MKQEKQQPLDDLPDIAISALRHIQTRPLGRWFANNAFSSIAHGALELLARGWALEIRAGGARFHIRRVARNVDGLGLRGTNV